MMINSANISFYAGAGAVDLEALLSSSVGTPFGTALVAGYLAYHPYTVRLEEAAGIPHTGRFSANGELVAEAIHPLSDILDAGVLPEKPCAGVSGEAKRTNADQHQAELDAAWQRALEFAEAAMNAPLFNEEHHVYFTRLQRQAWLAAQASLVGLNPNIPDVQMASALAATTLFLPGFDRPEPSDEPVLRINWQQRSLRTKLFVLRAMCSFHANHYTAEVVRLVEKILQELDDGIREFHISHDVAQLQQLLQTEFQDIPVVAQIATSLQDYVLPVDELRMTFAPKLSLLRQIEAAVRNCLSIAEQHLINGKPATNDVEWLRALSRKLRSGEYQRDKLLTLLGRFIRHAQSTENQELATSLAQLRPLLKQLP